MKINMGFYFVYVLQPHHKGQFIMDFVCRQLNIAEKDYFGLRYVDTNKQRVRITFFVVKHLPSRQYFPTKLTYHT